MLLNLQPSNNIHERQLLSHLTLTKLSTRSLWMPTARDSRQPTTTLNILLQFMSTRPQAPAPTTKLRHTTLKHVDQKWGNLCHTSKLQPRTWVINSTRAIADRNGQAQVNSLVQASHPQLTPVTDTVCANHIACCQQCFTALIP